MTLSSMTGFARAAGHDAGCAWTWEARSVNGKGLDQRCRLPSGMEHLESSVRGAVAARFARGNFNLALALDRSAAPARYRLNRELLDQVLDLRDDLGEAVSEEPPRLEGLLAIRGMIEAIEEPEDKAIVVAREQALARTLDEALDALAAARAEEGARIGAVTVERLEAVAALTAEAEASAAAQPAAIRARLETMLGELLSAEPALPEERLAQEAALLVGRSDVREELDRLGVHVAAARDLLDQGGAIGRRLDFLCQELNREANTLCSKSADVALTRLGLALKAAVEQVREQVQNLE
ncbi:MAG: YicC/YloC family endoribonuclease [Alphaproteobacteria bacterium]